MLATTVVTQWLFKVTYEALVTPATYGVVNFLKRCEGQEVFDTATLFNPFAVAV